MKTTTETKTKVCTHCGRELPVEAFSKRNASADGLQLWCRECYSRHNKNNLPKRRGIYKFTSSDLIDELKSRGYTGTLRLRKENTIEVVEE